MSLRWVMCILVHQDGVNKKENNRVMVSIALFIEGDEANDKQAGKANCHFQIFG